MKSVTGGAADTLNNSESVFLPAGTSGSYTGTVTGATITVRLRGGLAPWHVTSHNVWSFNSLPTPPLNYMPTSGGGNNNQ